MQSVVHDSSWENLAVENCCAQVQSVPAPPACASHSTVHANHAALDADHEKLTRLTARDVVLHCAAPHIHHWCLPQHIAPELGVIPLRAMAAPKIGLTLQLPHCCTAGWDRTRCC